MRRILSLIVSYSTVLLCLSWLTYCVLLFILIFHHELWHEEMQGWLIAKDSRTLTDLYFNLRYEAHPMVWYLCLFVISRFTHDPLWMQIFNGLVAALTAFVVLRYAPFHWIYRILFVFGYFPLFEYGVMSRNYLLGMLTLFLTCVFLRQSRLVWAALMLFIVMQTSIMALLVALVLSGYLLFQVREVRKLFLFCLLLCGGMGLALIQIIPPQDFGITVDWVTHFDLKRLGMAIIMVWRGYVPIPRFTVQFWNSSFLVPDFSNGMIRGGWEAWVGLVTAAVGACVLFFLSVRMFWQEKLLVIVYVAGSAILLLFFYIFYYGALRHWGFLFLLFICVWWLARVRLSVAAHCFVTFLLLGQVIGGLYAGLSDYHFAFSSGQETARFIKRLHPTVVVGADDTAAVTVAGYLDSSLYYPQEERVGNFAVLTKKRKQLSEQDLVYLTQKKLSGNRSAVFVSTNAFQKEHCGVYHLRDFTDSITSDRYSIYAISNSGCL